MGSAGPLFSQRVGAPTLRLIAAGFKSSAQGVSLKFMWDALASITRIFERRTWRRPAHRIAYWRVPLLTRLFLAPAAMGETQNLLFPTDCEAAQPLLDRRYAFVTSSGPGFVRAKLSSRGEEFVQANRKRLREEWRLARNVEAVRDVTTRCVQAQVEELGADSLVVVELVMAFEEELGIEIADDAAQSIVTVGDAIKAIENAQS